MIEVAVHLIEKYLKEINEALRETTNHEMAVYYRGIITGLEYAKGVIEHGENY